MPSHTGTHIQMQWLENEISGPKKFWQRPLMCVKQFVMHLISYGNAYGLQYFQDLWPSSNKKSSTFYIHLLAHKNVQKSGNIAKAKWISYQIGSVIIISLKRLKNLLF